MKAKTIFAVVTISILTINCAAAPPESKTALTIYNDNFGVVRELRDFKFHKGINELKFTDVASAIDPTSVTFECVSAPGKISILEQNYEYDLVNTDSLLKRYIDKQVEVSIKGSGSDPGRTATGVLMASMGGEIILKGDDNQLEIIQRGSIENIVLTEMPDDLVTRPTLLWLAHSEKAGTQQCRTTYTTENISWKADYTAILGEDDKSLDFSGWVTINNQSGATYEDAAIKLIAGDVRRVQPAAPRQRIYKEMAMMEDARAAGFEEKAFLEYHMYTLGRTSTINNRQVKQIEFIEPARGVAAEKVFIYERSTNPEKVQIKIEFENTEENQLGIALPKGKVRVFKKDPADDSLEFVGEDLIDHTPRKERLSLYIGNAFDIVPEHKMTDHQAGRRMRKETHEIELRNRKDEPVTVFVDEKFPMWVNWTIEKSTHDYEKRDATTARFTVRIEADSTETVRYSTTWTW